MRKRREEDISDENQAPTSKSRIMMPGLSAQGGKGEDRKHRSSHRNGPQHSSRRSKNRDSHGHGHSHSPKRSRNRNSQRDGKHSASSLSKSRRSDEPSSAKSDHYQRRPRHQSNASMEKKEKRTKKAAAPGAENVSSTGFDKINENKLRRSRNSLFSRRHHEASVSRKRKQEASPLDAITVDKEANNEIVRQQVQAAITHIIMSPDTIVGIDDDSEDSDTEDSKQRRRPMCTVPILCFLALLMVAMGGGAVAYIILDDPFNPDSAPMTHLVSDQISNEIPSGSPAVSASKAPSEALTFGPRPSKEDCEAIRNGQDVDGQDETDALYYDIVTEVILDEEGNYNGTMTTLVAKVQEELLPSLAGCTDLSRRKLGRAREDISQPLLQKSRRLEDTQYPIVNARVSGAYDSEATCRDDVMGDCRVGMLTLEIFVVKGEGEELDVEDIVINVFQLDDLSLSLGEMLGLIDDTVLDIKILTLENVIRTDGPNNVTSPTALPSVNPAPTTQDIPSLAPILVPTTPEPNRSPSTAPTRAPTFPPMTQVPIPGLTPSPTLSPSVAPMVRLTPVPTLPPTKQPTLPPTKQPTSPPTKQPTLPPTKPPTLPPTKQPTLPPTKQPTPMPTLVSSTPSPSSSPSNAATSDLPSNVISSVPSRFPSSIPTSIPSATPSKTPSNVPSLTPTMVLTSIPPVSTPSVGTPSVGTPSVGTPSQKSILLDIYTGMNGSFAAASPKFGWQGPGYECAWLHVTCVGGKVTFLNLYMESLSGTLSTRIGELTSLTKLQLGKNSIGGTIPTEIGLLTDLTELNFSSNNLVGAIPSEMINLLILSTLWLNNNNLSGVVPKLKPSGTNFCCCSFLNAGSYLVDSYYYAQNANCIM